MKTKRFLALVLAMLMVMAMVAGCSKKESGTSEQESQTSSETTDNTDSAEESSEEQQTPSGDVPTFKVATVRWTDAWPIDFLEMGVMKQLEEKASVDIEWQVYYNGDWSEQKSLLLAGGDLPDAFLGSIALNASDMFNNLENITELTPYINAEIMPNLTAAMEKSPELKAIATSRDGKIYSLPKKLPLRPTVCGDEMYINKEWLDRLGLSMPTNIEELANVMEAFATQDADGDGDPTNHFALTASAGGNLGGDLRHILAPFGTMVSRDGNYMGLNKDGNPVFVPAQENYKQAVNWMHDLWTRGVLDPEYFTQEASAVTSKLQNEGGSKVGVIFGWTADAQVSTNVGQFELVPAIEGYDGTHYVEAAANYLDIADREFVITNKCADPETLLKWADGFYDDLVSVQTFYGSIPDQIQDNGDGTYTVLVPADGTSLDTSAWSWSLRDFGPKFMNPEFYGNVILPEDQGDGVKLGQDSVNGQYVTNDKNCGLPMMQYTDEELSRLTAIGVDLYTYVEAQYAHWVIDGGIDDEWDAYLDQLKAMGLDEFVSIHENAYKAYQESMG